MHGTLLIDRQSELLSTTLTRPISLNGFVQQSLCRMVVFVAAMLWDRSLPVRIDDKCDNTGISAWCRPPLMHLHLGCSTMSTAEAKWSLGGFRAVELPHWVDEILEVDFV